MGPLHSKPHIASSSDVDQVRDPLATMNAVLAARQRPMSERLELALSWNKVAAELRVGLSTVTGRPAPGE
jgi:hypothetical protein